VVTFTKNVTTGTGKKKKTVAKTAQILWTVTPNDAKVELGFNKKGGVVESGMVGLKYGDLMAFTATSNATVTASGLPAGIKLARLDGKSDEYGGPLGERALPAGSAAYAFTGFTTKAGTYLVTVKATLNGKTVTQRVALVVEELPVWAKGTYNGNVKCRMENGELGEELGGSPSSATDPDAQERVPSCGLATITVSAVGKISGKFSENGTNWKLSAACYTGGRARSPSGPQSQAGSSQNSVDAGTRDACPYQTFVCSNVVAKYSWKVKSGKKTVTKTLTREFVLTVSPVPVVPDVADVPVRGFATLVEAVRSASEPYQSTTEIEAWQNLWGSTYKALGKKLFTTKSGKKTLAYKTFTVDAYINDVDAVTFIQKGDEVDKTGLTYFITLSLKVTTAGTVTATLSFDTGKKKKDPKTKKMVAVIYKPTCSTVVIPTSAPDADPFTSGVYVYFAPSAANNFTGFGGWVPLTGQP
jgi:hypothetical protein